MKLDWERVRLLIWLRKCQTRHALAKHGRGWWAGWQHILTGVLAVGALIAGVAAGWAMHDSETGILLAWDIWAAAVCYFWLSALAAEAQRADPIDAGRLLHLPVSLREAFLINFAASLYNFPNVIGLAGALGLAGGHAIHQPAAFAVLPAAVLFLLAVSAWAQVLRAWFLKVFRDPRRRRWLNIVAGLVLALAGQLPNLVNLLNMQFSRAAMDEVASVSEAQSEKYDPAWATLPPDTDLSRRSITTSVHTEKPRLYEVQDGGQVYRVTYNPMGRSSSNEVVIWQATHWQVRDGVWHRADPPVNPFMRDKHQFATDAPDRYDDYTRATENLDGVPADLRDLWPAGARYTTRHHRHNRFSPWRKFGEVTLRWHAAIPPGWPAWVAASSRQGMPVFPFLAAVAGFTLVAGLGLRRAWSIQCAAVLMTEKAPRGGFAKAVPASAARWKPDTDKSASIARPLPLCTPAVSCLARTFLRQWGRSVEIRFQIIVACGLASGAVGFGFFLRWTERTGMGAFHVVSSIVGLTCLAFMGLLINFFGYDRGACRAMILAPVPERDVLLAKNAAIARLIALTSLPFVIAAAAVAGEWLMSAVVWILVTPSAILLFLALGNSSSVENAFPVRIGQRTQARPDAGLGNGCLHMLLYMVVTLIIQIPQFLAGASGSPWVGVAAACLVLAAAWAVWRANWKKQIRRLRLKFPDVADAVGKATDM